MKTNFKRIGKQSISIVLAVMMMLSTMLVGMVTSNAAETWYVIGDDYDTTWNTNGKSSPMSYDSTTGYYYFDKKLNSTSGNHYFRLHNGSNEYGPTTTNDDISISSYNTKFDAVKDRTAKAFKYSCDSLNYRLWFDATTQKIWITDNNAEPTEPTEPTTPASDIVVYFANPVNNGWTTVCNYIWKSNTSELKKAWPGDEFTDSNVCQSDYSYNNVTYKVYKVKVPAAYDSIIFNNGNNGGVQTGDITSENLADRNLYIYNQSSPTANVDIIKNYTEPTTNTKHSVTYTAPTGEGVVSATINPTETELVEGLTAGTNVTVTVTVNKGYTASLTVDGADVKTSTSGNTYTFTFSMPAQNITVAPQVTKAEENTGTEIQGLYLIYTTKDDAIPTNFEQHLNLYYDSNNQVYAYFKDTKFDTSKTYKFMISTLKGENSFRGTTNYNKGDSNSNVNVTTTDSNSIQVGTNDYGYTDNGEYYKYHYGLFSVKNPSQSTVSSVKINLGYYNKTAGVIQESAEDTSYTHSYKVIPISGVEGMVQVFAKDGTIRDGYQKYADMANTVLTAENADLTKYDNENKYYETAYANPGTKLKITTTILPDYREKYFVKAFSINGYSYGIIDASQADKIKGVYTCEYTIPEDFEGKRIEITPIYYYIDDTDTVTFYVEGFDAKVQEMWGNTVAVQAWYENGEKKEEFETAPFDSLTKNALGGYPGQPLVYQGGKYSMQIPKCLNDNKEYTVKGITLNNYFWDNIHKQNFDDQSNTSESNCQTYDFDDFYKLSDTPDVDNIIFDFRYRTKTDNDPKENLTSSAYDDSELEQLKDYYGNIVDIFGTNLSKEWTTDYEKNHLTVISNGYVPITSIGDYATEWSVYDSKGNYINKINCSSLINKNKVDPTYQTAYDELKQKCAGLPVKIAYEKSNYYSGDNIKHKGTRADGRWYFSKKAQKITANVQIEYRTDDNSFVKDRFVDGKNVGTKTGAQAYFTNDGYNGQTTCEGRVGEGNFSVQAQTDAEAKYYFIGWYLKTSDGYSFITNKPDADFPMTNNDTYVARFITTPSGTLTLSHTLLDGSAQGKTYISAKIVDPNNNNKVIYSIPETSDNLVIPKQYVTYASKYSIVATLRTVPYGNDTVEGFYEGYSIDKPNRYNETFTGTGEKTHSVTREIQSLFKPSTDADGNVSYKLIKSNIPFYSNIKSNPINYQITYVYFTRLDDQQIYVIKDTVSGIELEEMWAANEAAGLDKEQLSKAFITKKAPFVSNYREEITWDMDHAIIDYDYTATVFSNTKTVNPKISALTVAGSWTLPTEVEYGTLAKSNGDYLYKTGTDEFPAKFNYSGATDYEFSFWAIFDNLDAAQNYSNAVATYMSGTPDADMSKRLTALTTLNGYDKLIAKSYSKEYNYISYQDYYIVPVYANRFAQNEIKESQASIRLLEYTRNQWTNENGVKGDGTLNEGGSKTDYLYTDFALSFDKDQELIKNNANIKVGIAFEIVAKYDAVKDDLKSKSFETPSNTATIGDKVKAATANGKVGTYEMNGASRSIYRYEINNSDISVKNRIEYYLQFKNNNNAQQNVMKVYSYIYDTESGDIHLSAPVYMNMYDIGNLTYITSDLASIDLQPATELG